MKVNLSDGHDIRNGYLNIVEHPLGDRLDNLPDDCEVVIGSLFHLDPILNDGVAEEIVFHQPLNSMSPEALVPVLEHWKKKLKSQGVLKCMATDIRVVGKALSDGTMTLQEGHSCIFGGNNQSNHCLIDAESLKHVLTSIGFGIKSIALRGFHVVVEGEKIEEA